MNKVSAKAVQYANSQVYLDKKEVDLRLAYLPTTVASVSKRIGNDSLMDDFSKTL